MRDLYDYSDATYEECIDDLNETIEIMNDARCADSYEEDINTLERRGIRIQNIAQRLKELEEL